MLIWRRLLIILLNLINSWFIAATEEKPVQKTENLAIGACSQYDSNFCSRQVENSVCNYEKNECFCRKGFVAIRENGRVTCKTLLTDLKCRVDRDCVHVNRSSCHPGAGYCSCPGNTIYVPEKHACRSRFTYPSDPFCDVCLQLKGTCFKYELFERVTTEKRVNPNGVGCVCPDQKVSISTRTSDPLKYMCDGNLVDIGSECDDESLFCRSINSICKPLQEELLLSTNQLHSIKSNLWSENFPSGDHLRRSQIIRTCQCKPGYLPVYQINLKYNECFKILPMKAKHCQKCVDTGGQCYDLNDDGIGDGCDCPPSLSSIVYGKENSEIYCGTVHVSVNCTNGYLSVCYYPHTYGPYSSLFDDLINHRSVARLASDNYMIDTLPLQMSGLSSETNRTYHYSNFQNLCTLKSENDTTDTENTFVTESISHDNYHLHGAQTKRFCLNVDVWRKNGLCGIRLYKLSHDTVQYEGILEVLVNTSIRTPSRDKIIPIKCISRIPNRPMNKISDGNPQTFGTMNLANTPTHPQISLRILNERNKEILSAFVGSHIRLDALLRNPSGSYKHIAAEYCYGNNRSLHSDYFSSDIGTLLIDHRCLHKKPLLTAKFSSIGLLNGHLQTELFQAFRLGNMTLVFFTCVFRICQLPTDCEQTKCKTDDGVQKIHPTEINEKDNIIPFLSQIINNNSKNNYLHHIYKGDGYFFHVQTYAHIEVNERHPKLTYSTNNNGLNPNYLISNHQLDMKTTSSLQSTRDRSLCNYTLCLTTIHLSWILLGLFMLLILFCITLILIYRKYRLFLQRRTLNLLGKHQQQNQSIKKSLSILAKNDYSEHSSPSRIYNKEYYQTNYLLNPDLPFNSTLLTTDNLDMKSSFQLNPLTPSSIISSSSIQSVLSLPPLLATCTIGSLNHLNGKLNICEPTYSTNNNNMTLILKNSDTSKHETIHCDNSDLFYHTISSTNLDPSKTLHSTTMIPTSITQNCYCQSMNYSHYPFSSFIQPNYVNNNEYIKTISSDDCFRNSSYILNEDLLQTPNCVKLHSKQCLNNTDMIDLYPSTHDISNKELFCIQNIQSKLLHDENEEENGLCTTSILPNVICSIPSISTGKYFYSFHKPKKINNSVVCNSKLLDITTLKDHSKLNGGSLKTKNSSVTHLTSVKHHHQHQYHHHNHHHELQCSGSMIISNNNSTNVQTANVCD
ncbi:hypothetical protein MS3_00010468 [Schistosoma haematobium]|uniref:ZP domain-containing protein n=1 Tax=Schistosoma haematobium TaxID=6185 RepID=A0A922S3T4_SCHHA|nr:hypothetical protein MS3_00010468 [Schistosoma haematobium]KAH9592191.1 hypothetical protein MS3_00010468 [Schistosoma haematobium]CAH8675980.1 unnamed protein product [Schistosoma haematobium]CAH8679564.1 unnamed protein product [Schistosoma haematobium]